MLRVHILALWGCLCSPASVKVKVYCLGIQCRRCAGEDSQMGYLKTFRIFSSVTIKGIKNIQKIKVKAQTKPKGRQLKI